MLTFSEPHICGTRKKQGRHSQERNPKAVRIWHPRHKSLATYSFKDTKESSADRKYDPMVAETNANGDSTPSECNRGKPIGCSDLSNEDVARNLKDNITNEEDQDCERLDQRHAEISLQ